MAVDLCIVSVFVLESVPGEIAPCDDNYYHSRDYEDSFAADFWLFTGFGIRLQSARVLIHYSNLPFIRNGLSAIVVRHHFPSQMLIGQLSRSTKRLGGSFGPSV
jgi:hypothetical protein